MILAIFYALTGLVLLVYFPLLFWRINLVSAWRLQRIDEISIAADAAIRKHAGWYHFYEAYSQGPSFNSLLFDLRIWSYSDAYPESVA